jgi:hypothetical protein
MCLDSETFNQSFFSIACQTQAMLFSRMSGFYDKFFRVVDDPDLNRLFDLFSKLVK